MARPLPEPMEPDVEPSDSESSIFDDSGSGATSLAESILNYRKENGRTYHGYKDGSYLLPNDDLERTRLNLEHHMCLVTLDNKLYLSPLDENIKRVLDVGTGAGTWAIEFAEEHPSVTVLGNDLSPIRVKGAPSNVSFEVDDAEAKWSYRKDYFDFIHARMLMGAFFDWPKFLEQCFRHTAPGGWLELHSRMAPLVSDDGTMKEDMPIYKWAHYVVDGMARMGQPMDIAAKYKTLMIDAGYENVTEVIHKWPTNPWPKGKKEKLLGVYEQENLTDGLPAFCMAFFTRVMGWSKEAVEVFMVEVRRDIRDRHIHAYSPIYIVYGQKPKLDHGGNS